MVRARSILSAVATSGIIQKLSREPTTRLSRRLLAEISCRPAHLVSTNEQLFPTAFLQTALAAFVRSFSMNAFVHLSSAQSLIIRSQALYLPFAASRLVPFHTAVRARKMSSTTKLEEKFAPARRVAGQKQDVWYLKTLACTSVEVVLTLATKVNR
jgi:hypothetical protein